ncbi:MAG TPA: hypothetical protein VKY31_16555, partial [Terriglobia bacterium]|nr:hypothetical protein [Terriglobia bacterium]
MTKKRELWIVVATAAALLLGYNYTRGGQQLNYPAPTRQLQLIPDASTEFQLPAMPINAWVRSQTGDLIFLSRQVENKHPVWKIVRESTAGGMNQFPMPAIPELQDGIGQAVQDIALDSSGSIYVPILWRFVKKQNEGVGVVVLDTNGNFKKLISLHQRTEIRHMVVGSDGSLYVLGSDSAYFNRQTDTCYLLHKYTQDGDRVAAFSTCPDPGGNLRQPGTLVPGKGYDQLMHETQRGSVWLNGDSVFQLLPYAHEIREFSLSGAAKGKTVLDMPPNSQVGDIAFQVFPRTDGTRLVVWMHMEVTGLNSISSGKYMALHDGTSGRALSLALPAVTGGIVPFVADSNGQLFGLARAQGGGFLV